MQPTTLLSDDLSPGSPEHRRAWIAEREAELLERQEAERRARNPALAAALDRIEAAFPNGSPKLHPLASIGLAMEYERLFRGATVVVADGFVEARTCALGDGRFGVAA